MYSPHQLAKRAFTPSPLWNHQVKPNGQSQQQTLASYQPSKTALVAEFIHMLIPVRYLSREESNSDPSLEAFMTLTASSMKAAFVLRRSFVGRAGMWSLSKAVFRSWKWRYRWSSNPKVFGFTYRSDPVSLVVGGLKVTDPKGAQDKCMFNDSMLHPWDLVNNTYCKLLECIYYIFSMVV